MDITLPLDYTAIERILPHRYPFLLVDRITELVPDQRIVGIKNVTLNERYLAHRPGEALAIMHPDTYQDIRSRGLPMQLVHEDPRRILVRKP